MSTFFQATQTATSAFYGDFKLKAYYNVWFHIDGITTFLCHILRALYNLTSFLLRAVILPLSLLNPFLWLSIPGQMISLVDHLAGLVVSLMTVAVHPLIFVCRTLSSLVLGYEDNDNPFDLAEEEEDLTLSLTVFGLECC